MSVFNKIPIEIKGARSIGATVLEVTDHEDSFLCLHLVRGKRTQIFGSRRELDQEIAHVLHQRRAAA